jgi:biotin synthase-related radical SAM superfamily protein
LEHLRKQTGIDFKPYKMDLETLMKYQEYSKMLTDNDRVRLKNLKGREFDEIIDYMLDYNCKLEQEAIQF